MATHWMSRQPVRSQRRSGASTCCVRDAGREGDGRPRRHARRFSRVGVSVIRRSRALDNGRPVTLSHCRKALHASAQVPRPIFTCVDDRLRRFASGHGVNLWEHSVRPDDGHWRAGRRLAVGLAQWMQGVAATG